MQVHLSFLCGWFQYDFASIHISHASFVKLLKAQQNQNLKRWQNDRIGPRCGKFSSTILLSREQICGFGDSKRVYHLTLSQRTYTYEFQNTMQPRYTHVSRSTLKRDAMKLWVAAKQATIDGFAKLQYKGLYNMYYTKYGSHQTQSTTAEGSSSQKSRDPLSRMVHGLTQHKQRRQWVDPISPLSMSNISKQNFVRGLHPRTMKSYDVLGFWKTKKIRFPVLSRIPLDI
ncbi:hypothetical protein Tco_0556996 [Tanacetum coccineum]